MGKERVSAQGMSGQSVMGGVIVALAGLGLLGLFAAPVVGSVRAGFVGSLTGNADASAAMVYALVAPMLVSLAGGFLTRLAGLAVAAGLGYATRTWVGLVEVEALGMALALTIACIAAIIALLLLVRLGVRRQRGRVAVVAWALARATSQVTEHLRRRYGGSSGNGRPDGPLNQVLLVEALVFNVLAAAEAEATPRDFAAAVVHGLAEMRDGVTGNTVTDPHGYGAIAAAEYCARLAAELRRMVPGAPPVPRHGAVPLATG